MSQILVNNLVALPANTKENKDQGEDTKEENKGADTKRGRCQGDIQRRQDTGRFRKRSRLTMTV